MIFINSVIQTYLFYYYPNLNILIIRDYAYKQASAIPLSSETHGGDDVGIWATGKHFLQRLVQPWGIMGIFT